MLEPVEMGAYIRLVLAHYSNGVQGIPDNDKELIKLTGVSPKVWKRISPNIRQYFTWKDGFGIQKRVLEELNRIATKSTNASANSLKRWNSSNADAMQPQSERNAIQDTEYNIQDTKEEKYIKSFEEFWSLYPKKTSKKAALERYQFVIDEELGTHDEIMSGVRCLVSHAQENKTETKFIKNPAKWLDEECWHDFDEQKADSVEFNETLEMYKKQFPKGREEELELDAKFSFMTEEEKGKLVGALSENLEKLGLKILYYNRTEYLNALSVKFGGKK